IGLLLPIEKTSAKHFAKTHVKTNAPASHRINDWNWVGDALQFDSGVATNIVNEMEIYNSSQQLVASTSCPGTSSCSINTATLPRGSYVAYAYATNGTYSHSFGK